MIIITGHLSEAGVVSNRTNLCHRAAAFRLSLIVALLLHGLHNHLHIRPIVQILQHRAQSVDARLTRAANRSFLLPSLRLHVTLLIGDPIIQRKPPTTLPVGTRALSASELGHLPRYIHPHPSRPITTYRLPMPTMLFTCLLRMSSNVHQLYQSVLSHLHTTRRQTIGVMPIVAVREHLLDEHVDIHLPSLTQLPSHNWIWSMIQVIIMV